MFTTTPHDAAPASGDPIQPPVLAKASEPRATGAHRPPRRTGRARLAGVAIAAAAAALAAGCQWPLQPARMALPPALEAVPPQAFEGLGGGRSGRFVLDGQPVTFRRMGDALSVLERVNVDRVSIEFAHAGAQARCDGRATTLTAAIVNAPVKPLSLVCRWSGPVAGELSLNERILAAAGTRHAREGQARFGALVVDIRSEHALAGTPLPLSQPAGYRLQIDGRDVAALDLAGGVPSLRRAAGLDAPTQAALTQVALALGLLFDPAVTRG